MLQQMQEKVIVDSEKCIACGACFDACEHNAREYQDDTKSFFTALEAGKKISVILAPAFLANYPHEYKKVLGYLKEKGVNHIYSVSFGADITTWGYLKYITEHQFLVAFPSHVRQLSIMWKNIFRNYCRK